MYLLKLVSQQGQTLQQIRLQSGSLQRIAAVDNVHYQLADAQSGLAAQGVQAGRAGDDLLVHIHGEPALLIEDYFLFDDSGLKNPLLGLNGSGQYVAYPITDSAPAILEHQLAGEVAAGTSASAPPAAVVAGIAGVALVGAAIAGGSKGSRSANDETPQPQTPFDPGQPAPPPPGGGGTNPPPPGGGGTNPPPPGGGGANPPPATDTTPPTLAIRAGKASLKPGEDTQITFTLSEKVAGFDASDVAVTGGTLSNFTQVNDTTYTATFTAGTNPGNASLRVDKSAFKDAAGNANDTASSLALTIAQTPNTPPDSADKTVPLPEDGSHTFSAADFAFGDPDPGHTLKAVRIDTLPDKGTLALNGAAVTAGQIIAAADLGKLAYAPETNGNGDSYARFTFSVQDSQDAFDPTPNTITFNVTPVNDAPQAADDHASTAADTAVTVDVLGNDRDIDGDSLTITNATLANPAQGRADIVGSQIRFTPAAGISGDVAIAYTVEDGKGGSANATLTVTVGPDATPPTLRISAANPSLKPGENTQITFTLSEKVAGFDASDVAVTGGTLSNFTQVNDTTYTATFTAGTNPGNASLRVDKSAFKDAAGNANDTASSLALTIAQTPNTPPDSADKTVSLPEDGSHTFSAADFAFGDPDPGHTLKAVRIDTLPDKGTLTLNGAAVTAGQIIAAADLGKLAYAPETNGNGDSYARFTFSVQDSQDAFDPTPNTITFNVTPVNDAPTGEVTISGNAVVGQTLAASHTLQDADGLGNITYRWFAGGQEVGTGSRYTIAAADKGKAISVRAEYTDGDGTAESVSSRPTANVDDPASPPPPATPPVMSLIGPALLQEGGEGIYTVMLDKPAAEQVTVGIKLGVDRLYNGAKLSEASVSIPAGQDRTFFKVIAQDDPGFQHETGKIQLWLAEPKNATLGSFTSVQTTVANNDPPLPIVRLETDHVSLKEGGEAVYHVRLDKAASRNVTVDIELAIDKDVDGIALNQTNQKKITVTIPAGQLSASFTIAAKADGKAEDAEVFVVTMSNPQGARIETDHHARPANNVIFGMISDADSEPVVSLIGMRDRTIAEGGETLYTVTLDKVADREVVVKLAVGGDTGQLENIPQEIRIAAGQRSAQFALRTLEDTKAEGAQKVSLSLFDPQGARLMDVDNHFNLTIIDNDRPTKPVIEQSGKPGGVRVLPGIDRSSAEYPQVEIRFVDEYGQQHTVIIRGGHSGWTLQGAAVYGISVDGDSGAVTIDPELIRDGSEVIAVSHLDTRGSPGSEEARFTAGNDAQTGGQSSSTLGTDGDDILIAPDVNPADYATLLATPRYEAYQELDGRAELLLGQSANDVPLMLDGKAGNDILISLNSADTLRGGDGLDKFVFIADDKASLTADKILDFHAGMDSIFLLGGQREITNARFDEGTQTLHYQSGQGADVHYHSIVIQADHGNPLLAYDVEKAMIIL